MRLKIAVGVLFYWMTACGQQTDPAVLLAFGNATEAPVPQISFDNYHSQAEIASYLREVAEFLPEHATFSVAGQSLQGREIAYISLGEAEQKPAVFINATHHGDERSTTEGALAVLDYLLRNRDNADITALLNRFEIVVMPLVNPDGHARGSRSDSRGRDPNRDYSYPQRSTEQSFDLPETDIIRQLQEQKAFRGALAFHSGMEAVLWPWCYTSSQIGGSEYQLLRTLSQNTAKAMNISYYTQSARDYRTTGEYIDYAYMTDQTRALTVEVSKAKTPHRSQLKQIVSRTVAGTMAYLESLAEAEDGNLQLVTGPDQVPEVRWVTERLE